MAKSFEEIVDKWRGEIAPSVARDKVIRLGVFVEVIDFALQLYLQPANFKKESKGKTFSGYWTSRLPNHLRENLKPLIDKLSEIYRSRNEGAGGRWPSMRQDEAMMNHE